MLNDIITGIAKALGTIFGPDYRVYENDVKQGLTEPCFFIATLKPDQKPLLGERSIWHYPFDIHYFPKEPGTNEELYNMAEQLAFGLRYITIPNGDLLRGLSISYEAVDGVYHVSLCQALQPYKEVFMLRVLGELKFQEIAGLFDKSESWAKVTFYRAKDKLIELMEAENEH